MKVTRYTNIKKLAIGGLMSLGNQPNTLIVLLMAILGSSAMIKQFGTSTGKNGKKSTVLLAI